jgi:hypothetical protein
MSLKNSNLLTHYQRIHNPSDNSFIFITETGIEYKAYFLEASDYFPDQPFSSNLFMFGFEIITNVSEYKGKKTYDEKVKNTIAKTISDFLEYDKNRIVIYVCDPKDEKDVYRSRLFNKWFVNLSGETPILKIDDVLYESAYISALLRNDNPFKNEFTETFFDLKDRLDK